MAIIFDASARRIVLDSASVSVATLYSRSADWLATGDNAKYGALFRLAGGDDLGGGLSIPFYYFLQGAWRIRPMEMDHTLTIQGNIFVEGGADPVVRTLGPYNVLVKTVVPVQAQAFNSTGGSTGPTADAIAAAVRAALATPPMPVDVRSINGVVLRGAGTSADPMRPL